MMRKIFRTGNSTVVSLPKEMLDALHLAAGEEVSVELDTEQGRIVIAPSATSAEGVDADDYHLFEQLDQTQRLWLA